MKEAVFESARSKIGYKKGTTAKTQWVLEDIIIKMDERRRWKSVNNEEGEKV